MDEVEEIVGRLDRRPGFKVVAHCEVGLPIFSIVPLITFREQSKLGVIEETVLKCIRNQVDTLQSIVAFLGIPEEVVQTQIGALLYVQAIRQSLGTSQYILTALGNTRLAESSATHISKEQARLFIDGLTRQFVPIEPVDLYGARQLETLGIAAVLPSPRTAPRAEDLVITEINRLFALYAKGENAEKLAVKVDGYVRRTFILFRRAIAMGLKADSGRGMAIAFAVDGRLSNEHEMAFSNSGADQRSSIFKDLFDASKRRNEVAAARRHMQEFAPGAIQGRVEKEVQNETTLRVPRSNLATPQAVRTLSSYEHPAFLKVALESAKLRLLLISPWIRAQVVNKQFISRLTTCIERGVAVTIAFGLGKSDRREKPEDAEARMALEALSKSNSNFRLIRKGNIHAKVLLVDDRFFITTSFNWLSFRGDPSQPLREEEGTYVEGREVVEQYFANLDQRLLSTPTKPH